MILTQSGNAFWHYNGCTWQAVKAAILQFTSYTNNLSSTNVVFNAGRITAICGRCAPERNTSAAPRQLDDIQWLVGNLLPALHSGVMDIIINSFSLGMLLLITLMWNVHVAVSLILFSYWYVAGYQAYINSLTWCR